MRSRPEPARAVRNRRLAGFRVALATVALLALSACSVKPAFQSLPAEPAPAVFRVAGDVPRYLDQPVVWGGMILEVSNFERHTEIELLAYPLDERQRPMLEQPDHGRFIALLPGYVEARDYPPGRFLSLIGRVTGDRQGSLRGAGYVWPEVDVDRMYLWPRDFREPKARFSIGVGVGVKL